MGFVPSVLHRKPLAPTAWWHFLGKRLVYRTIKRRTVKALFTGLVEELGTIVERSETASQPPAVELVIGADQVTRGLQLGDSIAVNGACLTVVSFLPAKWFQVTLAPETLRRTSLGQLVLGDAVNLERSLAANGRFGGHIVQGHVDTTGRILDIRQEGDALWFTVHVLSPPELGQRSAGDWMPYLVPKGFIAVDGVSLTVCDVSDLDCTFTFMLIPYTQDHVTLSGRRPGDLVNLEMDIMGKYVQRLLETRLSSLR
jgi:riboflavin synthase